MGRKISYALISERLHRALRDDELAATFFQMYRNSFTYLSGLRGRGRLGISVAQTSAENVAFLAGRLPLDITLDRMDGKSEVFLPDESYWKKHAIGWPPEHWHPRYHRLDGEYSYALTDRLAIKIGRDLRDLMWDYKTASEDRAERTFNSIVARGFEEGRIIDSKGNKVKPKIGKLLIFPSRRD